MSGSTTTAALTTRAIADRTSVNALTALATWANNTNIPTVNLIAYWDGRYQTTSNSSNLAYCNKGAFGAAATYAVDDATANGALGTGTGLTTERSVYYGLVTVNNASQTRATGIYAPTSGGTAGYVLIGAGTTTAPTWHAGLTLSGSAAASYAASFAGTTASSSTTTGAVKIAGGLGVAGQVSAATAGIYRAATGAFVTLYQNTAESGALKLDTLGPANTEGWVSLTLGNNKAKATADNASGKILLYHSDGAASTISAGFDSVATTTKAVTISTGLSVAGDIESTAGFLYTRAGSIWAGTSGSTAAERDVGVRAGSGNIYLYAAAATTGNRGIYCSNASGTGTGVLTLNQSNQISGLAVVSGTITFNTGADTAVLKNTYSSTAYNLIRNHNNGNISLSASSGGLYIGYENTTLINWINGKMTLDSVGMLVAAGNIRSIGAGEHWVEAQNSTYGNRILIDVAGDGKTSGVWSSGYVNSSGTYTAGAKWLIYRNANNATVVGDSLYISGSVYPGANGTYYFASDGAIKGNTLLIASQDVSTQRWQYHGTSTQIQFKINSAAYSTSFGTVAYHITSAGAAGAGSSRTLKHSIMPIQSIGEKLDRLKPVTFVYNWDKSNTKIGGLILEDTYPILPEICFGGLSNPEDSGINYAGLTPYLLKEIQELRKRVKLLEEERQS